MVWETFSTTNGRSPGPGDARYWIAIIPQCCCPIDRTLSNGRKSPDIAKRFDQVDWLSLLFATKIPTLVTATIGECRSPPATPMLTLVSRQLWRFASPGRNTQTLTYIARNKENALATRCFENCLVFSGVANGRRSSTRLVNVHSKGKITMPAGTYRRLCIPRKSHENTISPMRVETRIFLSNPTSDQLHPNLDFPINWPCPVFPENNSKIPENGSPTSSVKFRRNRERNKLKHNAKISLPLLRY